MCTATIATFPQSIGYSAWKLSTSAQDEAKRVPEHGPSTPQGKQRIRMSVLGAGQPQHENVPWKSYLVSRQIQDIAGSTTDAIFLEDSLLPTSLTPDDGVLAKPALFSAAQAKPASSQALASRGSILLGVIASSERQAEKASVSACRHDEPIPFARAA